MLNSELDNSGFKARLTHTSTDVWQKWTSYLWKYICTVTFATGRTPDIHEIPRDELGTLIIHYIIARQHQCWKPEAMTSLSSVYSSAVALHFNVSVLLIFSQESIPLINWTVNCTVFSMYNNETILKNLAYMREINFTMHCADDLVLPGHAKCKILLGRTPSVYCKPGKICYKILPMDTTPKSIVTAYLLSNSCGSERFHEINIYI